MTSPSNNSFGMDESNTFTNDIRLGLTVGLPEEYHGSPHSVTPFARSCPQASTSMYHPEAPLSTAPRWKTDSAADQEFSERDEALLASLEEQFGETQAQSEPNYAECVERELLDQAALYKDEYEDHYGHHSHHDDYSMEGSPEINGSFGCDTQNQHHYKDHPSETVWDSAQMNLHIYDEDDDDVTQGLPANQELGNGYQEVSRKDEAFVAPQQHDHRLESAQNEKKNEYFSQGTPVCREPENDYQKSSWGAEKLLAPLEAEPRRREPHVLQVPNRARPTKRVHMDVSESYLQNHHRYNLDHIKTRSVQDRINETQDVFSDKSSHQKDSWIHYRLNQSSTSAGAPDISAQTSSAAPSLLWNVLTSDLHNLLHAEVKKNAFIDTQVICKRVETEIGRHSISREKFARIIIGRSEQVLSELLQNPMPWNKMRSGRYSYRRMHNWLLQPLATRLAFFEMQTRNGSSESSVPVATQPKVHLPIPSKYWPKPKPRKTTTGEPTPKRTRVYFTDEQKKTLEAIFQEMNNPPKQKQYAIAESLGLAVSNVTNYFKNARSRKARSAETMKSNPNEQNVMDFPGPNNLNYHNF